MFATKMASYQVKSNVLQARVESPQHGEWLRQVLNNFMSTIE